MATASRADICACLAQSAARVNALEVGGIFRISDLIKTAESWQPQTALRYNSGVDPDDLPLECWSDAGQGDQTKAGMCPRGYPVAGHVACGAWHVLRRPPQLRWSRG